MAALLLAAIFVVSAGAAPVPAPDGSLLYLVSRRTHTHVQPSEASRPVAKLKTFDIVSGREAAPGWLEIDLSTADEDVRGQWLAIDRENLVSGTIEALKYRVAKAQQARWPENVRLDVARGRVKRGFTAEQVRLALGDPREKQLLHEDKAIAEAWIYEDLCVVVSMRGVTAITSSSPQKRPGPRP